MTTKRYTPIGRCIYCGTKGPRLEREHIVPHGLGGTLVLPKASCGDCAKIIGKFEGICQRTILGNLRVRMGLPTRRPKERPTREQTLIGWHSYVVVHIRLFAILGAPMYHVVVGKMPPKPLSPEAVFAR